MNILGYAQKLGKALMLPIATLPVAALLLRLGQPDLLDIAFMAQAGNAIFSNLPLLFGLGIAIGLSKDCLLYTSPSPRDLARSRMPSSA